MSKPQPQPSPDAAHAVSGRYVRLERGGRNNALVRCERITVKDGHVVMVEQLHPFDSAAISLDRGERALWEAVGGRVRR